MCLVVTGFPENWNKVKIKNYVTKQTGLELLNIGMQGLKTCFSFRRSDVQKAVQALNGAQVDGRQITVESATPKVHRQQNITFATVLYELALANGITPLLDQQQFYLLEKSLRTLYVGNIAQEVTELEIASCFRDYGSLEDVSLVLNLETGEHRGFAFVVFDSHKTCEEVLATEKFHSINGNIVKVQSSKPPKAVAELAKQAGLNDMEGHRTPLLEQMLSAARQQVEIMEINKKNQAKKNAVTARNVVAGVARPMQTAATSSYIQDPKTGQLYIMPTTVPQFVQAQPSTVGFNPLSTTAIGLQGSRMSNVVDQLGYVSPSCIGLSTNTFRQPATAYSSFGTPQAFQNQLLFQQPLTPQHAFSTAATQFLMPQQQVMSLATTPGLNNLQFFTQNASMSPTNFSAPNPALIQQMVKPQQQTAQSTQASMTQQSLPQAPITQAPLAQPPLTSQNSMTTTKPPNMIQPSLTKTARFAPY